MLLWFCACGPRQVTPVDPGKDLTISEPAMIQEVELDFNQLHEIDPLPVSPTLITTRFPWRGPDEATRDLDTAVESALIRFEDSGYPLANIEITDVVVDTLVTLVLSVDPGPRAYLESLRFSGANSVKRHYLRRVTGWRRPGFYQGHTGRDMRSLLIGTGLFESVEGPFLIKRAEPDSTSAADSGRALSFADAGGSSGELISVDLLYRLKAAKVNRFTGLLGYTNREKGLFGFVDLTLGNLLGTGRAAHLFWQSRQNQETRFELSWHEPFIWRLPLELDLSLTHEMEDTLYAETKWGANLIWAPAAELRARIGWANSRLVLGSTESTDRNRKIGIFGLRRDIPGAEPFRDETQLRGWSGDIELSTTADSGFSLLQGQVRARQWAGWGKWAVLIEETGGIISGTDSLLRSDALSIGGGRTMRGFFEQAYRTDRYLLTRLELGPMPSAGDGSRFYGFIDAIWFREWVSLSGRLYGKAEKRRNLWAAGLGLQTPSRAGSIRLDYAVPKGEAIWRGRIHFGLSSQF